jgi:5-methylcytosine-specific restriction endonuclease McrA
VLGVKAGRHWESLVGYNVDQLKKHLEKRFKVGMTWDNYGPYWHIDHIIPISAFNFETPNDIDFKKCWALKNLQPLEAVENLRKNDRLKIPFQPSFFISVQDRFLKLR